MSAFRYLVSNIESSIEFYQRLGFEVLEQWGPAFAIVSKEGLHLWLSGPTTSAAKPMSDGRVPTPGGWNRVVVTVSNLGTLVENLQLVGVSFRNEILTGPGGSQILVDDPDGNPVELFEPRN